MEQQQKKKLLSKARDLAGLAPLINRLNRAQHYEDVAQTMRQEGLWLGTVRIDQATPEGAIHMVSPQGGVMRMAEIGPRNLSARELHAILGESDGMGLEEHSFNAERLDRLSIEERMEAFEMEDQLELLDRVLSTLNQP